MKAKKRKISRKKTKNKRKTKDEKTGKTKKNENENNKGNRTAPHLPNNENKPDLGFATTKTPSFLGFC